MIWTSWRRAGMTALAILVALQTLWAIGGSGRAEAAGSDRSWQLLGSEVEAAGTNRTTYAANLDGDHAPRALAADTTPPAVIQLLPEDGEEDAGRDGKLTLTFDEPVEPVAGRIIQLFRINSDFPPIERIEEIDAGSAKVLVNGATVEIRPSHVMSGGTTYQVYVPRGAFRDASGNLYSGMSDASPWTFTTAISVPDAPTGIEAESGFEMATVSFDVPSNGGSPIRKYTVAAWANGTAERTVEGLGSPIEVTGLTKGKAYTFTVTAVNAEGDSAPSAPSAAVVPDGLPDAPSGVTAVRDGGEIRVSFAPSAVYGIPVTGYVATAWESGAQAGSGAGEAGPIRVTGLPSKKTYTFTVTAVTAQGNSEPSDRSAEVGLPGEPGAPTAVTADPGDRSATVRFLPPADDGGSPITGYKATAWAGGQAVLTASGTSSPLEVGGLTNGTEYTFTVAAVNENGESPASAASTPVKPVAPSEGGGGGGGGTGGGGNGGGTAETYTADLSSGDQTSVSRERTADGRIRDALDLSSGKVSDAAAKLKTKAQSQLDISLPPLSDQAAEFVLALSADAAQLLAKESIALGLKLPSTVIVVPAASLQSVSGPVRLVVSPTRDVAAKTAVAKRAEKAAAVKTVAGNGAVTLLGDPVKLETNLGAVTLTLPAGGASDTGVYSEGSGAEGSLDRGRPTAQGPNGQAGIAIDAKASGLFAVVRVEGWDGREANVLTGAYITGYAGGLFKPNAGVTRAEMAAMLMRVLPADTKNGTGSFSDVPVSHWASQAIGNAVSRGWMKGYPDGTFRPEQSITRAEMAALLAGLPQREGEAASVAEFTDTVGHWAQAAIRQAHAAGLLNGYPDGRFLPKQALSRAEAVAIVNKLLGRKPEEDGEPRFADVPKTHWAFGAIQAASKP
ncbi:S-layer homology domain-containing protein [Cohnella nanjingensis]|uniref:S-layer homology domain-containing protein n=1 Tax=Cohnella nanjingensis TaxID=1387779 RepID=A0A7X0RWA6_9BACL|nr:S-layer homology domain-containing protein [Cohnella nanjingensis]MBB6674852.1 S-layer homology domain-containing protein [Cohnella nanjingensis]